MDSKIHDELGFMSSDGVKELHDELGGNISEAYVVRLLKRQDMPITPETIALKTQSLLIGRFRKEVKKIGKDEK